MAVAYASFRQSAIKSQTALARSHSKLVTDWQSDAFDHQGMFHAQHGPEHQASGYLHNYSMPGYTLLLQEHFQVQGGKLLALQETGGCRT
jgi:hypothetical protein